MGKYKKTTNWQPSVMFWQFKNDPKGEICKTVLARAGVDFHDFDQTKPDHNKKPNNNTKPKPKPVPPTPVPPNPRPNPIPPTPIPPKPVPPTPIPIPTPPSPIPNPSSTKVTPAPGASHVLSMFYCGFGSDYCGQSKTDDVNPKSAIVILAFVNTQSDGSVIMD